MDMTIDEAALIIGAKELENFQLRKELAQTRRVLEEVTRRGTENRDDKVESSDGGDDPTTDDGEDN